MGNVFENRGGIEATQQRFVWELQAEENVMIIYQKLVSTQLEKLEEFCRQQKCDRAIKTY